MVERSSALSHNNARVEIAVPNNARPGKRCRCNQQRSLVVCRGAYVGRASPKKLQKRDGGHGSPWPVLAISTQQGEEVAMKKELMLVALRFGLVIAPIAVTYLVS
jgi:hypothetical protein